MINPAHASQPSGIEIGRPISEDAHTNAVNFDLFLYP